MATHSSIFAWRVPWTEEPGGLQSIGLLRVRRDWCNLSHMHHWLTHLGCFNAVMHIFLLRDDATFLNLPLALVSFLNSIAEVECWVKDAHENMLLCIANCFLWHTNAHFHDQFTDVEAFRLWDSWYLTSDSPGLDTYRRFQKETWRGYPSL